MARSELRMSRDRINILMMVKHFSQVFILMIIVDDKNKKRRMKRKRRQL